MNTSPQFKRILRTAIVAGAAGVLAVGGVTACSSDDSDDASTPSAGSTSALPDKPATGEAIKVGFITMEGGAVSAPMIRQAGEAARDYLNNNGGGVGGHKLDLVVCKEQAEPASATACANKMVEEKVAAVLSPLTTQAAVILPIVTGAGIPFISPAPVGQVEMATPGAYMLTGGLFGVINGMVDAAAKDGVKKLVAIFPDTGGAVAAVQQLGTSMFKPKGIEFEVKTIPGGTADPTPQIAAALSGKPDAVALMTDASGCTTSLRALATSAPTVKKYVLASCLDKVVVDAVGKNGFQNTRAFTTVNPTADDPSSVLYRSILGKYAPEIDPIGAGYYGYQAVMGFGALGDKLSGTTSKDVTQALKSAVDVPLPAGPGLTFTCDGKANPQLPSLCGTSSIVSDVDDNIGLVNSYVVK